MRRENQSYEKNGIFMIMADKSLENGRFLFPINDTLLPSPLMYFQIVRFNHIIYEICRYMRKRSYNIYLIGGSMQYARNLMDDNNYVSWLTSL